MTLAVILRYAQDDNIKKKVEIFSELGNLIGITAS
jgi:hypothetical protein